MRFSTVAAQGFAVLDFETTGLAPEYHHRVIELAVVHVAPDGTIEGRYETVVNPQRDLGPTHIHGLRGADVRDAPLFSDIAGDVVGLLRDRVVVAHNATFEARFLRAELARAGLTSPLENADALCTMKLARSFLPGGGRSLADCCAAYGIRLENAHRALVDTEATAELLVAYLAENPGSPVWEQYRRIAEGHRWPEAAHGGAVWRGRSGENTPQSFLGHTVSQLPEFGGGVDLWTGEVWESDPEYEYLGMVDQVVADGFISIDEADELAALAEELGLDRTGRNRIHREYFGSIVTTAYADGVLDDDERGQIQTVGKLLSISDEIVRSALRPAPAAPATPAAPVAPPRPPAVAPGTLVVFTGAMPQPRDYYEGIAASAGLIVKSAVTKKVGLVVAEDSDSLSSKAVKARAYGIPIIGVADFLAAV